LGVTLEQRDDGITIAQIHPGTPAANVDLQEGDRIVAINDKSVDTVQQISNAIRNEGPDNQVKIKVNRDGKTRSVKVRLANLADIQGNR